MVNLRIYLREYKSSSAGIVWFSFYINRQFVNFSAKVRCEKKHWDKKKMCVKPSDPDFSDKNRLIETIRSRINDVFVKYRLKNRKLTRDAFLRAYHRPDDYTNFFKFIDSNKKQINWGNELSTVKTHNTVIDKLKEFNPELHFDDIDSNFLDRYYSYLRKTCKNNENTSYKNMAVVKKYVLAAWKMGYMDENPFANWKIKRGKANYTYLLESEIKILLDAYQNGVFEAKLHKTLEFFLFMCFSSLHVTDARNLKLEQFTDLAFVYYRVKTRNVKPEPITIPISETLRMILKNIVGTRKQGKVFENLPADQTMNRFLKDIAEILEIKKDITHKVGRHTFATYFLAKTKDLAALKELLGHSDLRETMIYAHVIDESKHEGMKCFNSLTQKDSE